MQTTEATTDHDPTRHDWSDRSWVQCGHCYREWCDHCTPTPAARCPFEYDHLTDDEDDA